MKTLLSIALCVVCFSASAQTNYLYYNKNRILQGDFLFHTDGYYYFQRNDTIYKIANTEDMQFIGTIQELPPTSAYQDLYVFTKKGHAAANLYLIGLITTATGSILLAVTDIEAAGIGVMGIGAVLSLSGFFTNLSAWGYGKRAGIKLSAIEFDPNKK